MNCHCVILYHFTTRCVGKWLWMCQKYITPYAHHKAKFLSYRTVGSDWPVNLGPYVLLVLNYRTPNQRFTIIIYKKTGWPRIDYRYAVLWIDAESCLQQTNGQFKSTTIKHTCFASALDCAAKPRNTKTFWMLWSTNTKGQGVSRYVLLRLFLSQCF